MRCTLHFLQKIFPEQLGYKEPSTPIHGVMTDSRDRMIGALFIPIIGERFNAHHFMTQAIEQGATAALWDRTQEIPANYPEDFVFFLVDDTTDALQTLAHAYRKKINPTVIGITGSNGKTTTKDLLHAVLEKKFETHATRGNFNNEIGLPLTILQMSHHTEMLILEMGMSDFHEIDLLSHIAEPDFAIVTNIGESHIEHLGTRAGIVQAKLEITNGLQSDGMLILDGDETLLASYNGSSRVVRCGFNESNDHVITQIALLDNGTQFSYDKQSRFEIPLFGEHHAKNASYAITLAKTLGMDDKTIQAGLQDLEYSSMRFEKTTGMNGVTLINDAYNASPTSMKAAINVLKKLPGFHHKIIVLGDILELGDLSIDFHQSIVEVIEAPINVVYTYGKDVEIITTEVKKSSSMIKSTHFTNKNTLMEILKQAASPDTVILFKASRGMAFETFIEALTE